MSRYLITASLFQSWDWYRRADDDGEARADLITYLKREPIPDNEYMRRGRQLENDIRAAAEGAPMLPLDDPSYEATVRELAEIVKGGLWQERISFDMRFRDHGDFLFYGKADVIRGPTVFDIKYKTSIGNYDIGDYAKGIQHIAYLHGAGLPRFAYLISNGKQWIREDYMYSEDHYNEMYSRLLSMLDDFSRDGELGALYHTFWKADRP